MITKLGEELVEHPDEMTWKDISGNFAKVVGVNKLIGLPAGIANLVALAREKESLTPEDLRKIKQYLGADNVPVGELPAGPFGVGKMLSSYEALKKQVSSVPGSYTTVHELGHATGALGRLPKPAAAALGTFMRTGASSGLASLLRATDSARKAYYEGDSEKSGDVTSHLLDYASKGTMAATGLQLAEEAQASLLALRAINKVKGGAAALQAAKLFAPAFGTYVAKAVGSQVIAPRMGKSFGEKLRKDRELQDVD